MKQPGTAPNSLDLDQQRSKTHPALHPKSSSQQIILLRVSSETGTGRLTTHLGIRDETQTQKEQETRTWMRRVPKRDQSRVPKRGGSRTGPGSVAGTKSHSAGWCIFLLVFFFLNDGLGASTGCFFVVLNILIFRHLLVSHLLPLHRMTPAC